MILDKIAGALHTTSAIRRSVASRAVMDTGLVMGGWVETKNEVRMFEVMKDVVSCSSIRYSQLIIL